MKQSGGYVMVYSEPGQGTTFKVYLPSVEEELKTAAPAPAEHPSGKGSGAILLVEDDAVLRQMIGEILAGGGYRVLEGSNADEALRLARSHPRGRSTCC